MKEEFKFNKVYLEGVELVDIKKVNFIKYGSCDYYVFIIKFHFYLILSKVKFW